MAQVERSVATLRISGEDLNPEEITKLLNCEPSKEQIKAQIFKSNHSGKERIAKLGMWRLHSEDCEPENLDQQISQLLDKMNNNKDVWHAISSRYQIDLFCGLFLSVSNEGLILSSKSLLSLGERGIALSMDIYAPDEISEG